MSVEHEPSIVVLQKDIREAERLHRPRLAEIGLAPLCEPCGGEGEIEVSAPGGGFVLVRCPHCVGTGRNDTKRRW